MDKRYIFKTYEELMEKMVGVSDPSIEEFIEKYRDVKYTSLFDRVIVDVHDVRIGEYFDREVEIRSLPEGTRVPIMFMGLEDKGSGEGSRTLEFDDPLEMTMLMTYQVSDRGMMYYFYDSSEGIIYSVMKGMMMTTFIKDDVTTIRELLEKLRGILHVEDYVFEEMSFVYDVTLDYVTERIGDVGTTISFDEDVPSIYEVSTDKGGRVTTMSTIGMSSLDTGYESGDREVGFELIAGYLNEIGGSSDWFYEMVYDLYKSDVSMSPGFCVTGLTELEKLNKGFVAVVMIPPSLWDSFELLKVENRAVLWLWAVPITSREFKLLQSGGLDELLEYWNKNRTQLLDVSRRDKRFKFF